MAIKKVMIEFADPRLRAVDHRDDLLSAYEEVASKWMSRHRIFANPPYTMNGRVFMVITMPDELDGMGVLARHLGDMSRFLLRDDFYRQYRVGSRLLCYYDSDDFSVDGHV